MINLCAKSEFSISTGYEDMKGDVKCREKGGLESLEVTGMERLITALSCAVSTYSKILILTYLPVFEASI